MSKQTYSASLNRTSSTNFLFGVPVGAEFCSRTYERTRGGQRKARTVDLELPGFLSSSETPGKPSIYSQIRIKAADVNHFDHDIREGASGVEQEMPHVLGIEGQARWPRSARASSRS